MNGMILSDLCVGCKNLKGNPHQIVLPAGMGVAYICTMKTPCSPKNGMCENFDPHPYFEQDEDDGLPE
jgi:hypothetical protein